MSQYSKFEQDILYEATNSMRNRYDVFHLLTEFVKNNPGVGIEQWFLGEIIVNPRASKWKMRKVQNY